MGGNTSKDESSKKADHSIHEESTGFHIFELHLPTLGFGFTSILLIVFVIFLALLCYRRCTHRRQQCLPGPYQLRPAAPPLLPSWTPQLALDYGHLQHPLQTIGSRPRFHESRFQELRDDQRIDRTLSARPTLPPSTRQSDNTQTNWDDDV